MISKLAGPRGLDPHQINRISKTSLNLYRRAAATFSDWLERHQLFPSDPESWDDCLVEWKNDPGELVTKARFETTISALEFVFPRLRKNLQWAHTVANSWGAAHQVKHAKAMSRGIAALFSAHLSDMGVARAGLGLRVQQALGLRPSELLGLVAHNVTESPAGSLSNERMYIFALGKQAGTKVRREQFAILRDSEHPDLCDSIALLLSLIACNDKLFPYSLKRYRALIKRAEERCGLRVGFSPHSPRAGFATDAIALGKDPSRIRSEGRWNSESSFKVYLDVIGAQSTYNAVREAGLTPAVAYCLINGHLYFTASRLVPRHGASGLAAQRGWHLDRPAA